jgi:hypothetical protein
MLSPFPSSPLGETLTRTGGRTIPSVTSTTKICEFPFVGGLTKPVSVDWNATKRPSALMLGD